MCKWAVDSLSECGPNHSNGRFVPLAPTTKRSENHLKRHLRNIASLCCSFGILPSAFEILPKPEALFRVKINNDNSLRFVCLCVAAFGQKIQINPDKF